ncbi:DUF927 domain-containing protein [Aestuariivirga sp.]|uniref:DUF927 domain-containing protein n=1 Tax=Aestuariivirga sp. TaxID=2650926 RepID=UPI0039E591CD
MNCKLKLLFVAVDEFDNSSKIVLRISNSVTMRNSRLLIDPAEIGKPGVLADKLRNHGVKIPDGKEASRNFISETIVKPMQDCKEYAITDMTGWHAATNTFVLKCRTYGSATMRPVHRARVLSATKPFVKENSLERWKFELGRLTRYSHSAVFAVSHALSGPLLARVLKITDVPVVNLWSDTSSGKSSLLAIANTCFESPSSAADMPDFNQTPRAREEELNSRNGLFMPVDEENLSEDLASFVFNVASGKGRTRSRAVRDSLPNMKWVCAILTSANRRAIEKGKEASPKGVRIVDLRIKRSEDGGVFEHGAKSLRAEDRNEILNDCLEGCRKNSGSVGHHWLKLLTDSSLQADCFEIAARRREEFFGHYSVGLSGAQLRILEKFANVYAAATLAAKFELVPWTEENGHDSIIWCYERYMKQNSGSYVDRKTVHHNLHRVVAEEDLFLRMNSDPTLASKRRATTLGFMSTFKQRDTVCIWETDLMKLGKQVGCRGDALRSILIDSGVLLKDADGKHTILKADPATGARSRFVAIDLKRLKAFIG